MKIIKFFTNLSCAMALTMPAIAQVPTIVERVDYNNKLYLTVTTPNVGHTSWFVVWVETPGVIAAVFTNNDWGGNFGRCRYDRGMWHVQALCGHGEERELKLLKGEVTCDELTSLGDMTIMYGRLVGLAPWVPPGGTPSFDANIVEVGTLYRFYTQGNKSYCRKTS